jgi:hypothetical protein
MKKNPNVVVFFTDRQRLVRRMAEADETEPEIIPAEPRTDSINRRVFPDRPYPGRDWDE